MRLSQDDKDVLNYIKNNIDENVDQVWIKPDPVVDHVLLVFFTDGEELRGIILYGDIQDFEEIIVGEALRKYSFPEVEEAISKLSLTYEEEDESGNIRG